MELHVNSKDSKKTAQLKEGKEQIPTPTGVGKWFYPMATPGGVVLLTGGISFPGVIVGASPLLDTRAMKEAPLRGAAAPPLFQITDLFLRTADPARGRFFIARGRGA